MRLHLFALSLAFYQICLLSGCRPEMSPEERAERHEYEIITQTIRELAISQIIPPPPPPFPDSSVAGSVEANNRAMDSLKREFRLYKDTATFLIAVFDKFTEPATYPFKEFSTSTYRGLKSQLLSGEKKTKPLDKKRIEYLHSWKMVEPRPCKGRQCGDQKYLGEIAFSRMAFNETFDLALFTYAYSCCALQGIILVKRAHGKWRIIRNDLSMAH